MPADNVLGTGIARLALVADGACAQGVFMDWTGPVLSFEVSGTGEALDPSAGSTAWLPMHAVGAGCGTVIASGPSQLGTRATGEGGATVIGAGQVQAVYGWGNGWVNRVVLDWTSAVLNLHAVGTGLLPAIAAGSNDLKCSAFGWGTAAHGVSPLTPPVVPAGLHALASGAHGVSSLTALAKTGRATGTGLLSSVGGIGYVAGLYASGSGAHGVVGRSPLGFRLPLTGQGVAKHPIRAHGVAVTQCGSFGTSRHGVAGQGAAVPTDFFTPTGAGKCGVVGHGSLSARLKTSAVGAGVRGKVWVRLVRDVRGDWPAAEMRPLDTLSASVPLRFTTHARAANWDNTQGVNREGNLSWIPPANCDDAHRNPFPPVGVETDASGIAPWSVPAHLNGSQTAGWAAFSDFLPPRYRTLWPVSASLVRSEISAWPALPSLLNAPRNTVNPWGASARTERESAQPWTRYSRVLNPGWGIFIPGTTTPEPGESIIIPVRSVYLVVNEFQLMRVSNMTPISASQLNISFDCDSWLPNFSATIHKDAREIVMPDPGPVEVEASINGVQFRFFVERITRSREFALNTVNISGRGIASELEAPYAVASHHTNDGPMNAQQLIDATLTNTGYSQTWGITDWLVPANALSLYGTPAQVAGHVAEAAGAVLAADWAQRDLRMLPRYPVKPWDWPTAVPGFVIPGAVTQTDSLEWIEKPSYNVVYVSGVQTGVLAQVKITGTAGDLPAPMVTHPLITHADTARQRGISILSDTGRKAMMQISLPVLESTGIIDICQLIEFNDGPSTRRGIVRANNIKVDWPKVRQTLTVEAHA